MNWISFRFSPDFQTKIPRLHARTIKRKSVPRLLSIQFMINATISYYVDASDSEEHFSNSLIDCKIDQFTKLQHTTAIKWFAHKLHNKSIERCWAVAKRCTSKVKMKILTASGIEYTYTKLLSVRTSKYTHKKSVEDNNIIEKRRICVSTVNEARKWSVCSKQSHRVYRYIVHTNNTLFGKCTLQAHHNTPSLQLQPIYRFSICMHSGINWIQSISISYELNQCASIEM